MAYMESLANDTRIDSKAIWSYSFPAGDQRSQGSFGFAARIVTLFARAAFCGSFKEMSHLNCAGQGVGLIGSRCLRR